MGDPLREVSLATKRIAEGSAREVGHHAGLAEALARPIRGNQCDRRLAESSGFREPACEQVSDGEITTRSRLDSEIAERASYGERSGAKAKTFVEILDERSPKPAEHQRVPESALIPQGLRPVEGIGQAWPLAIQSPEHLERRAELEADVNGLLQRLACLGQPVDRCGGVLEVVGRLSVR